MILANLKLVLSADSAQYARDLKRAQKITADFGKKLTSIGKKLTAGVTLPLAALSVASIKAASDVQESMNKVDVVFGDAAESVQAFGRTAARSVGMSRRQALEAAGTFGNLFTTMGLGKKAAADMSVSLVKLAADLASFNNISTEDALTKLRSGLVGEVEPLRSLGIALDQASVKAKAMEMGLADASGAVSQAALVQARYALILEQSGNALGDFARTSDGLANQMRILQAEWEDARAALGEQLLPVAIQAAQAFVGLLEAFNALPTGAKRAVVALGGLAAATGPALMATGQLLQIISALSAQAAAAGSWGALAASVGSVAVPALAAAGALAAVAAAMYAVYRAARRQQRIDEARAAAQRAAAKEALEAADNYEDYAAAVLDAAEKNGVLSSAVRRSGGAVAGNAEQVARLRQQMGLLTEAEWEYQRTVQRSAESADEAMLSYARYQQSVTALAETMDAAQQGTQAYNDLVFDVQDALSQYKGAEAELIAQKDALLAKMDELRERGWSEQSRAMQEVQADLDEVNAALAENASAYEQATKQIVFSVLQQKLAAEGNYSAILSLANGMGLLSDEALAQAQNIDALTQSFAAGTINAEQLSDAIELLLGLDGKKMTVEAIIDMVTTGPLVRAWSAMRGNNSSQPGQTDAIMNAKGGDWLVTRPTVFVAGENGPERAVFTPYRYFGRETQPGGARPVVVNIHYAPAVSLGDEMEAERVLAPLVADAVRRASG